VVRTVLGDVAADELGRCDVHEHLLMRTPAMPGDELDDAGRSGEEAVALRAAGIDALVELTTLGLGRDPSGLAEIARRSGLRIVMATGVQHEGHHPPGDPLRALDAGALADRFTADLLEGCDGTDVRAGVIKVGTGYWSISAFERTVLEAAGEAHRRTGAPVVCHLELGTAALEVLEVLEAAGVPPGRVALAHMDRNPDPGLHLEVAAAGAFVGYDGWARARNWPDSMLLDCLLAVAEGGGAGSIVLGADVARRRSFRAYGGLPGLDYLPRRVLPRLRSAGGEPLERAVLVDNPARLLALPSS
jgi:predicted metal-dependent phosphotriesterase family hydrolase